MSSVQSILDRKGTVVHRVSEDDTVLAAAHAMNSQRVGALVVTRGDLVVGIFTERDILCRVVAAQRAPATTLVRDVMTTPVAVCAPDTTRDECRAVMRHRRLRHLPVVNNGQLAGIVSIGDVLEATEADQGLTIHYLYEYMYGAWTEPAPARA
jgi:CBS domain-containing protein